MFAQTRFIKSYMVIKKGFMIHVSLILHTMISYQQTLRLKGYSFR